MLTSERSCGGCWRGRHHDAQASADRRQYLLHRHILESLGLGEKKIVNADNELPSLGDKDQFLIPFIGFVNDLEFKAGTLDYDQKLPDLLVVFARLVKGCGRSVPCFPPGGPAPPQCFHANKTDIAGIAVTMKFARGLFPTGRVPSRD